MATPRWPGRRPGGQGRGDRRTPPQTQRLPPRRPAVRRSRTVRRAARPSRSRPTPRIASDSAAEHRHSVHHAPTTVAWSATSATAATASPSPTRSKASGSTRVDVTTGRASRSGPAPPPRRTPPARGPRREREQRSRERPSAARPRCRARRSGPSPARRPASGPASGSPPPLHRHREDDRNDRHAARRRTVHLVRSSARSSDLPFLRVATPATTRRPPGRYRSEP